VLRISYGVRCRNC